MPLASDTMKDENKLTFFVIVGLDPTIHDEVKTFIFRYMQSDFYVVDSGSEAGMTTIDWLFSK